jgi:ATP-binding cassette subfamily C protein LapB
MIDITGLATGADEGAGEHLEIEAEQLAKASTAGMALASVINSASRLNGKAIDRLQLHHSIGKHQELLGRTEEDNWHEHLRLVALDAGVEEVEWHEQPDPARLPAISWISDKGWVLVRAMAPTGDWVIDCQGNMGLKSASEPMPVVRIILSADKSMIDGGLVRGIFKRTFLAHKKIFIEGAIAGAIINLLALATSIYSMQVYDRVIPTQGYATLGVLTLGVGIGIIFELIFKVIRSHLVEHAVTDIDSRLSREIFSRLLKVRLDQLPGSVGSLSSQIRGYETIRAFLSSSTFYILIDAPFGLLFVLLIAIIGGPLVALVPLTFLILSIAMGITLRKKIDYHAKQATAATNLKTGLLVEAIEGAETIKAGGGGWGALSRWLNVIDESIKHELVNRSISEKSGYFAAVLQQLSYVGLVGVGAYFAAQGYLTMGSLIACSILSGRALSPIAQIPGLMTQKAHAKAALEGLEKFYALETDNHNTEQPLFPEKIYGEFKLERVRFAYPGAPQALSIQQLEIKPGEKIGLVGHIGSGKSTLLRLLTGMYQANEGRILLDSLDIDQISRSLLADKIGYLQQDHRLFSGTLRQNLLIGIPDPGDQRIRDAAARTGLLDAINNHPKGLELMIAEGGKGLSGGQRQLVAMTRLFLSNPSLWLLDEPTASLDEQTEQRCINSLIQAIQPHQTMILVTHKPSMLILVNRLIVVANQQIILDGPRDKVIARLQELAKKHQDVAQTSKVLEASEVSLESQNKESVL